MTQDPLATKLMGYLDTSPRASTVAPMTGLGFELTYMFKSLGNFSEISGLGSELTTESYREGGVSYCSYELPTGVKSSNLVLKAGMVGSQFLWQWFTVYATSTRVVPLPLALSIREPASGKKQWTWLIHNAFPVKWSGPELSADNGKAAVESLELAHMGIIQLGSVEGELSG